VDSEIASVQRERKAVFVFAARVSLVRLASFPDARTSVRVVEVGTDVIVEGDC
jgi:hypothetical protein